MMDRGICNGSDLFILSLMVDIHGDASDNSDGPGCDVDVCSPVEHGNSCDKSVRPIMDVDACGEFMLDPTLAKLNIR